MVWYDETRGIQQSKEAGKLAVSLIALVGITYPPLKTLWVVEAMQAQQAAMQAQQAAMQHELVGLRTDVSKILALLERRK